MKAVLISAGWQTNFLGVADSERQVRKMVRDYNRYHGKKHLEYWMSDDAKRIHKTVESSYSLYKRNIHISMEQCDMLKGIHVEQIPCDINTTIYDKQIFGE